MYKLTICLLFFCILQNNNVSGQFSFGGSGGDYGRFKLPGSLGQLISGGSGMSFGGMSSGWGQILGSLINSASNGGSSGGGPLTQLATAASTQYINAIKSSPLLSQFTGGSSSSSSGPPPPNYGAPPMPYASHGPPQHHAMYNPMALLGGDSSMYGPPGPGGPGGPPQGPGFGDSHFGGSNMFPQFAAAPDSYYGPYGGPGPAGMNPAAAAMAAQTASLYPGSSSYGAHVPPPMHHLDRKK